MLLRTFIKEKSGSFTPQYWSMQHLKLMMAKSVCRALAEDRPLLLTRLFKPNAAWTPFLGVFAPEDPDSFNNSTFAFTCITTDHEFKDRGAKLARKNTRLVSLEVVVSPNKLYMTPKRWINGLWFFNNGDHQREITIPWPEWMK